MFFLMIYLSKQRDVQIFLCEPQSEGSSPQLSHLTGNYPLLLLLTAFEENSDYEWFTMTGK